MRPRNGLPDRARLSTAQRRGARVESTVSSCECGGKKKPLTRRSREAVRRRGRGFAPDGRAPVVGCALVSG
jgi:hypothetical protein